jgi:hypothetical protein
MLAVVVEEEDKQGKAEEGTTLNNYSVRMSVTTWLIALLTNHLTFYNN